MYIAPNTTVRLIKDCPLDNKYEHTIFFLTETAQYNYFYLTLTGLNFTAQTYQRVNRNIMRVAVSADTIYNYNYLMFQNTAYGNKWFYAFITKIDYVNNVTAEITYELDVMQTWHFAYDLAQCFVVREHSSTDVPGDNLVPENLETGEYVCASSGIDNTLAELSLVVACTFDATWDATTEEFADYTKSDGGTYSQLYTGLGYHVFPSGFYPLDDPVHPGEWGPDICKKFIANAGAHSSGIVSVFLMPTCFVTPEGFASFPATHIHSVTKAVTGTINGYTPKNNKLFTFPYNFLYVTNQQGNGAAYPYEFFNTPSPNEGSCQFDVAGDMSPNPSVILRPMHYKGVQVNSDEKMVLGGYPQLPFNIDAFKAWLAMNAANIAVDALSSATTMVTGVASGNPGAVMGGLSGMARTAANVYTHSLMPNQARGGNGSITACALRIQNFLFMRKCIRAEFAEIIDNFFTVYGYACHKVKRPNRSVRPRWNYVKTDGCKIITGYPSDATATQTPPAAGVPAEDAKKIEDIYNSGITFWKQPWNMGDYSLSNALPST